MAQQNLRVIGTCSFQVSYFMNRELFRARRPVMPNIMVSVSTLKCTATATSAITSWTKGVLTAPQVSHHQDLCFSSIITYLFSAGHRDHPVIEASFLLWISCPETQNSVRSNRTPFGVFLNVSRNQHRTTSEPVTTTSPSRAVQRLFWQWFFFFWSFYSSKVNYSCTHFGHLVSVLSEIYMRGSNGNRFFNPQTKDQ